MYPKDVLADKHEHVPQTAFVLMPFDSRFNTVYESIQRAVLEAGFSSCQRADDVSRGGHIMTDVLKGIGDAEVVIADVTGRNPNVFYELGITHVVKDIKSVLIIRQSIEDVPFDIGQLRHIPYEDSPSGLEMLRRRIVAAVKEATPSDLRFNIPEGETYTYSDRLAGVDRYLYDFDVRVTFTGRAFAKFFVTVRRYGNVEGVQQIDTGDYGLAAGDYVTLPHCGWLLNLDHVVDRTAHFCLCEPVTVRAQSTT